MARTSKNVKDSQRKASNVNVASKQLKKVTTQKGKGKGKGKKMADVRTETHFNRKSKKEKTMADVWTETYLKGKSKKKGQDQKERKGIDLITHAAVRKLCHRAGVERIGWDAYRSTKHIIVNFLDELIGNALLYTHSIDRKTVTPELMVLAAETSDVHFMRDEF